MTLAGKYQPQLESKWRVDNEEVLKKFIYGRDNVSVFSFDPIYMGDGERYTFGISLLDSDNHQFYMDVEQVIIPRQCLRVADL